MVSLTLDFASLQNKKATFLSVMNGLFEYISDMKLDWCKVLSVESDKFGEWVSENWCSLGRVTKWVYSTLDEMIPSIEEYELPTENVSNWNTKQCDEYLKHYGLKVQGKAAE
eukprot:15331536-Ditylum_brightwellii.AAC.1